MSDDDFWDIDQYLVTRRNQPVGSARAVDPSSAIPPVHGHGGAREDTRPGARSSTKSDPRHRRLPRDIAELHGLDDDALDPIVRNVLADLIQEMGHLHEDLRIAEKRIGFLDGAARHDTLGPWLGRSAFFGKFERLKALDRKENLSSAVVLFRIVGFHTLRRASGWDSADSVVVRLGSELMRHFETPVGHVADDQFAVLLPASTVEEAKVSAANPTFETINGPVGCEPLAVVHACSALDPFTNGLMMLTVLERRTYGG